MNRITNENGPKKVVMVRYGELFLKSEPVKRHFTRILTENIHRALHVEGLEHHLETSRGRILISGPATDRIVKTVTRIFGVVDAGSCEWTTHNPESLALVAVEKARESLHHGQSFAIRVKRQVKSGQTSQELAAYLGAEVLRAIPGVRVDLTHPDYEIIVEIRERGGFICDHRVAGPGGLPLNTQGKVLSLISSGIDSPVAAWLMMKRGCSLETLFIDGGRWSGKNVASTAQENVRRLSIWCPGHPVMMRVVSSEQLFDVMEELADLPKSTCIICKRYMIRVANIIAERAGLSAIVTGENIGQVASQTLPNLAVISSAATVPILRPLITYDKKDIIDLARMIGTFSGQQGDLACRAVPLRPSTKVTQKEIQAIEELIPLASIIAESLKESETVIALNGRIEEDVDSIASKASNDPILR